MLTLALVTDFAYITFSQADMAQLVEHNLAKVGVAGSSPVVRSIACKGPDEYIRPFSSATWPSGKAEACKAFTPGSNPGFASRTHQGSGRAPFSCASPTAGLLRKRCRGIGRTFRAIKRHPIIYTPV